MSTLCCWTRPRGRKHDARGKSGKSSVLEYLVLLNRGDDDEHMHHCCNVKCGCRSMRDVLLDEGSKGLQGVLHIGWMDGTNKCECCHVKFKVDGMANAHVLYARLPKEGIYVRVGAWEHGYLKSQVQELVYIFRRIGVRELEITVHKSDSSHKSAEADVGAGLMDYGVEAGGKVMHSHKTVNSIHTHLRFPAEEDENEHPDEASLLSDHNIHYLGLKPDWLNMVRERLNGLVTDISFEFTHFQTLAMHSEFRARVQKMGIKLGASEEDETALRMDFKARFSTTSCSPVRESPRIGGSARTSPRMSPIRESPASSARTSPRMSPIRESPASSASSASAARTSPRMSPRMSPLKRPRERR